MPIRIRTWRPLLHLLMMVMLSTVAIQLALPVENVAWAKRRKKRRKKRKPKSMTPRKKVELDDEISKTKDPLEGFDASDKPSLTPFDLGDDGLEALVESKLDEEIQYTKELLSLEGGCEDASPARFRLADLYWEKSKRAFFKSEDFERKEPERKKFRAYMKRLQKQTTSNYSYIVDNCEGYSETPKVLYYLGKTLIETGRSKQGAMYFKRIIQDYPNSPWEAQAWFMVGEYYFNEEHDARRAFKAYSQAAKFTDSPIYGFAVYKQGWCHINNGGEWDLALERFKEVLRISNDAEGALNKKGRISLRKEALKDFVRAYSNIGEPGRALQTFTRIGGGDYIPKMLEQLGQWYLKRDAHRDVITVYRAMIKQYRTSTRLPIFQGRIVTAASKMGDPKATVAYAKTLTKYFQQVRKKASSKKLNPAQKKTIQKDLKEAEGIAENTLRRLATDFHKIAQKTSGKTQARNFRYARELYSHYLKVFPKPKPNATVNYVFFMRYRYANVLFAEENFLEAATNYDAVVAMNPSPKNKKEREAVLRAAEDSVRAYDELVEDLDRKNPPKISGTKPKPIPEIKKRLIRACKQYIKYFGKEGENAVQIRYKIAYTYYTYNHLDLAAPAFLDTVKNFPENEVACKAANLALDIYNGAKNYAAIRRATRAYQRNKRLACTPEEKAKFGPIEESATFFLIKQEYEDKKLYVKAGNAYMNFYRQYKTSKIAIEAVYNAAVNYQRGQRLDKANETREFLVRTFGKSSQSKVKKIVKDTTYDIAGSFERVVDFRKAAKYLSEFAAKYPEDKRTKDAVFNAGLYLATLRDFEAARAARQKFLDLYPNDKDAATVKFSMCETLEEEAAQMSAENDRRSVKKWDEAHNCFYGWVRDKSYTKGNPDLLCAAQFRRGEIMSKVKNPRGAQEQVRYLKKMWPMWSKVGVSKVPRCAAAIAELKFRELDGPAKNYRTMLISELNPTDRGKKKFDASIAGKTRARERLVAGYKEVVGTGVAEWALASLYMIGEAYRDSVDKLVSAKIPDKIPGYKLTADDKKTLRAQLEELAQPVRNLAVEAYRVCVDKANELGVYNSWSTKAYGRLQKLEPTTYQPLVERIPKLKFATPFQFAHTGVVIREGERLKVLAQKLKDGVGPPRKKKSKASGKNDGTDSIPAPAAENTTAARGGHP